MSTFRADVRQASAQMLRDYALFVDIRLQVYPGRPTTINPPTAFIDQLREVTEYDAQRERRVQADILIVHGLFDSKVTAESGDAFVDGFVDWSWDRFHAAGPDTSLAPIATIDDPTFVPEWIPESLQRTYFATRITLEGRTYAL